MKHSKLQDLFEYLPKSKIKAGDGLAEGKYPLYTSSGKQSKYLNEFQNGPDCLVFGTGGNASIHLTTDQFSTTTDCIVIKPKSTKKILSGYVYQYFKGHMQVLKNGFKGAGLKHISKAYLSELQIPYPKDINEQRRIVNILSKVERIIESRQKKAHQLDKLLESAFNDIFGDPIRNEKGWSKRKFDELLINIDSGTSPKCEATPAAENEWGVLKLGAITKCFFKEDENKALPANTTPTKKDEVKSGDLLFSRKNTPELVAACAYVFETRSKLLMPDLIFRFVLKNTNEINPVFLWKLLTSHSQRKKIQSLASGAAGSMPNISKANLKKVMLPVPPISLQNQFASIVKKVESIKSQYQQSLLDLEELYGSLSQKAFKGYLDLSKVPLPEELEVMAESINQLADKPVEEPFPLARQLIMPSQSHSEYPLSDPTSRRQVLEYAFTTFLHNTQIGDEISLADFWETLLWQAGDYADETDLPFNTNDYDLVKKQLFQAIADGKVEQMLNKVEMQNEVTDGNQIILKKLG